MRAKISSLLKKILGRRQFAVIKKILDLVISYKQSTYSQFGEDRYLLEHFKDVSNGFFVDVGAYHPRQFSNTYLLYKRGWRGVNIDATPGSMTLFRILRPRDINRELVVSDSDKPVRLAVWGTDSENTVSEAQADAARVHKGEPIFDREMQPRTLTEILAAETAVPRNFEILSVDVEGWDLQVLKSLDWNTYRPKVVLVEQYAGSVEELMVSELYKFISEKGYLFVAWYNPTVVFKFFDEADA